MNLFLLLTLYGQNNTQNNPRKITIYMLNSIYVYNNIKIFIYFINIFRDMSYTKAVEYKNIFIISRKAYPMTSFFIRIL